MRIPERASNFSRTAWPWLKAILTIATGAALLTIGLLLWTTRIHYDLSSPLYEYQTEIQLALAAFTGLLFATLIDFGATRQMFITTTVLAFILMSATAIAALLIGVAEEKLGLGTLAGLMALPLTAAVATKAANIASRKKGEPGQQRRAHQARPRDYRRLRVRNPHNAGVHAHQLGDHRREASRSTRHQERTQPTHIRYPTSATMGQFGAPEAHRRRFRPVMGEFATGAIPVALRA